MSVVIANLRLMVKFWHNTKNRIPKIHFGIGFLWLSERQKQFIKSGIKDISRKEYSYMVKCAIRTAASDLKDLLDKSIVKKIGGGKYIRYTIS